jgi:hypothetical protein
MAVRVFQQFRIIAAVAAAPVWPRPYMSSIVLNTRNKLM